MARKILLLNSTYEVLSFVTERKAIKLVVKNKVEVLNFWDDIITFGYGNMKLPSILRLINHVKRNYYNSNFSRRALIKRDENRCQYCAKTLSASRITIDHIIPRSQGGITSYTNCVVCCFTCNSKKANRTPEQAMMVLMKTPKQPTLASMHCFIDSKEQWHSSWDDYLKT